MFECLGACRCFCSPRPYYCFAVAGSSLQVLAIQKEAVAMLLQLLSRHRGALLWTLRHFVHQARCTAGSCLLTCFPILMLRPNRSEAGITGHTETQWILQHV